MTVKKTWRLGSLFILCLAFGYGCGKKASTESALILSASNAATGDVYSASSAMGEPNLVLLTQALRKYSIEHKGLPGSFSELVSAGYVKTLPAAPPGQKFEINRKTAQVILVKQ